MILSAFNGAVVGCTTCAIHNRLCANPLGNKDYTACILLGAVAGVAGSMLTFGCPLSDVIAARLVTSC